MNDITLKINNSNAELGDLNISLGYNIVNPNQPDLRGLPSSYSIKLPKTNTNMRLIKEGNLNTASLEVEYLPLISGELVINSSDKDYWNCTITSSDVNFIKELGSRSLTQLKEFNYIDQTFKQASIYNTRDLEYTPFALDYDLEDYLGITCNESISTQLKFDGINDWIDAGVSASFNSTNITIDFTIKSNDASAAFKAVISKPFDYGIFDFNGTIQLFDWSISSLVNSGITTNTKKRITAVFNNILTGGTCSFYENGIFVITVPYTSTGGSQSLRIGDNQAQYFNGNLGAIRIWDKVLTPTEILTPATVTTNLLREFLFNDSQGFILNDTSTFNTDANLLNYSLIDVTLGVDNKWLDENDNPVLTLGTTCAIVIDGDQINNQLYKSHVKPKSLSFALQSFGNFYRLPNKEAKRVDNYGVFLTQSNVDFLDGGTNYPEVIPYLTPTSENDMKGTIPPVKILLYAKKAKDYIVTTSFGNSPISFEGYLTVDSNNNQLNISAIASNAQSWELLDENEIYSFLLVDSLGDTQLIPNGRLRYLGYSQNIETTVKFAITTDELSNFNLVDSLAYNDIPPMFNFYTILEKLFSQYGIVLKTDSVIYNKLINEFLTYNGNGFVYNYKNHLGIATVYSNGVYNDGTFYFNGMRTTLSSTYTEQLAYNKLEFYPFGNLGLQTLLNSQYLPYYPVNTLGIWSRFRTAAALTGRNKYDFYSGDGSFIVKDNFHTYNDKTTLFFTIPILYETQYMQEDKYYRQIAEDGGLTHISNPNINLVNSDYGILENTTLTGNKFVSTSSSLITNYGDNTPDYSKYTGKTNYGYYYRAQDNGTITMSIDLDYTTNEFTKSEWGGWNLMDIPTTPTSKPVYLVVTKTKNFKDYETLDAGLTRFGKVLPNNETIVKYWDLVEYQSITNECILSKKVKEIFNFKVVKDEVINVYVVFTGYTMASPGLQGFDKFGGITYPIYGEDYNYDYTAQMELTKCDINIMFNGDYFIDVAKNLPEINQLQFFKDILIENRLLPYYDNVSKTLTLKQFNEVAKDYLVLDKFNIEEADSFNNYNKNILIGYSKDSTNQFNNASSYDFNYNTITNKDSFKYEFSYCKTEDSAFKTYSTRLDSNKNVDDNYLTQTSYLSNPNFVSMNPYDFLKQNSDILVYEGSELSNKGVSFDSYKDFKIATISSVDNMKLIGRNSNWSFGYNTNKVTLKQHFGTKPDRIADRVFYHTLILETLFDSGILNVDFKRILINFFNPLTFNKLTFDSCMVESHRTYEFFSWDLPNAGTQDYSNNYPINLSITKDWTSKLLPIAQRGQYRFRNGLLTNERASNFSTSGIDYDEIQPFATKDFDFVNYFYRNYGYNFEKETLNNNTLTISGILPFTDYYKITNEGIVKVWFDNNWYYLLEVVKFDVETEQCTLKVIRKIYGD